MLGAAWLVALEKGADPDVNDALTRFAKYVVSRTCVQMDGWKEGEMELESRIA